MAAQGRTRRETNRRHRHRRRTTTCCRRARCRGRRLPLPCSPVITVQPSSRRRRCRRLRPPPPDRRTSTPPFPSGQDLSTLPPLPPLPPDQIPPPSSSPHSHGIPFTIFTQRTSLPDSSPSPLLSSPRTAPALNFPANASDPSPSPSPDPSLTFPRSRFPIFDPSSPSFRSPPILYISQQILPSSRNSLLSADSHGTVKNRPTPHLPISESVWIGRDTPFLFLFPVCRSSPLLRHSWNAPNPRPLTHQFAAPPISIPYGLKFDPTSVCDPSPRDLLNFRGRFAFYQPSLTAESLYSLPSLLQNSPRLPSQTCRRFHAEVNPRPPPEYFLHQDPYLELCARTSRHQLLTIPPVATCSQPIAGLVFVNQSPALCVCLLEAVVPNPTPRMAGAIILSINDISPLHHCSPRCYYDAFTFPPCRPPVLRTIGLPRHDRPGSRPAG